jgi:sec-independent protein translocase protein TatA
MRVNLGAPEILFILLIVLVLFGGKRLPELARSIGKGLAEFRRATQEVQREISAPLDDLPSAKPSPNKASASESEQTNVHVESAPQPRDSEKPPGSAS